MPKNKPLAKVFHFDSYGKRQEKYDKLLNSSVNSVDWTELQLKEPYYFFVPKDFAAEEKYNEGFSVSNIFIEFNSGIQTKRDKLTINFSEGELLKIQEDFENLSNDDLRNKYDIAKDGRDWTIDFAKADLKSKNLEIVNYNYRPLDIKKTFYTGNSKGFIAYPRNKQSKHMLGDNLSLISCRNQDFNTLGFISKHISDMRTFSNPGSMGTDYFFPLYLYGENQDQLIADDLPYKKPNIDSEIIQKIEKKLGLTFVYDVNDDYSECKEGTYFTPENLLDYIYAVLHSKSYRETYKEFLKIDFPRVPFDVSKDKFFKMTKLGEELRSWHLLENEKLIPQNFISSYPVDGDNLVGKIKFEPNSFPLVEGDVTEGQGEQSIGKVFLNDSQYFDGVPEDVWEFYIGGYQSAQKWIKDRKGRALEYEDILHYGKIILTLSETIRIMNEIEEVFEV